MVANCAPDFCPFSACSLTFTKSSLSAHLKQKKPYIEEGVRYLARKRGIEFEEMWNLILTGQVGKLSPDEYKEFLDKNRNPDQ
jgi:hypothetical protein